jgi:hypothetical protein
MKDVSKMNDRELVGLILQAFGRATKASVAYLDVTQIQAVLKYEEFGSHCVDITMRNGATALIYYEVNEGDIAVHLVEAIAYLKHNYAMNGVA